MAIITISQGSYSKGKEVAEKVADRLGYRCISREVLLETSKEFNVPEVKLVRAIHDAPSFLDRFTYGREKYIAFIQAGILKHFRKDNVVYCGLAGHIFVENIRHVLKVRIIADLELRIQAKMAGEAVSREEALRIIKSDDEERKRWSHSLYGIDPDDPDLYDLVVHIGKMSVEDAARVICEALHSDGFKTTPESQQALEDLALAAEVKAALVDLRPDVSVRAEAGTVEVKTAGLLTRREAIVKDINEIAKTIAGVKNVRVTIKSKDPVN